MSETAPDIFYRFAKKTGINPIISIFYTGLLVIRYYALMFGMTYSGVTTIPRNPAVAGGPFLRRGPGSTNQSKDSAKLIDT